MRLFQSGSDEGLVAAADSAFDQSGFDLRDGIDEPDVGGYVDDPEFGGGEHHRDLLGPGQRGEHLGVPGESVAGRVQCLLVQWGGADRLHVAGHCEVRGAFDVPERGIAGDGRELTPGQVTRQQCQVDDIDDASALLCLSGLLDSADLDGGAEHPGGRSRAWRHRR
jgi:hypothetical protein